MPGLSSKAHASVPGSQAAAHRVYSADEDFHKLLDVNPLSARVMPAANGAAAVTGNSLYPSSSAVGDLPGVGGNSISGSGNMLHPELLSNLPEKSGPMGS